MSQNLAWHAKVLVMKIQECSGMPTGGSPQSMRGYSPKLSRSGGGFTDQYLQIESKASLAALYHLHSLYCNNAQFAL